LKDLKILKVTLTIAFSENDFQPCFLPWQRCWNAYTKSEAKFFESDYTH
jgi:hypothetical protein